MWKSIESAPKDGTRILVVNRSVLNATPHIAAYNHPHFYDVWDTKLCLIGATHWHPIPKHDLSYDTSELLNWINLINNVVCLLPDTKDETVKALVEARNKVLK